jgi:deoxyadenosine/deoxycytidine kinase
MIYLHRSTTDLQQNIRKRGREYEQAIQNEYLDKIKQGYFDFFKTVNSFPILMLNMDGLSFLDDRNNYHKLIKILEKGELNNGLNVINI